MTNSEAIKQLKERYDIGQKEYLNFAPKYIESLKMAMESLEENDKLKAEIEQLKSELEQSVKLPCRVGDIIYAYSTYFGILAYEINSIHICCGISFEAIASRNDDMLDSFDFDIEDIGKTIFLTKEEAEQHLKGKVKE